MSGYSPQQCVDCFSAVGMTIEHRRKVVLRVEHQVEVGSNRFRAVPDKTERLLVVGAATHIGAKKWGGVSLLLPVPRGALSD